METKEIFKDIYGYEGLYQVSNFGNIKSSDRQRLGKGGCLRSCPGRILKPKINNRGYYQVDLFDKNNKSTRFLIHRLVALAFLENPNNYDQINHIDNDHTNNCVTNLEWCNNYQNNLWKKVTSSEKQHVAKNVLQYSLDGTFIKEWESAKASEKEGFDRSSISKCCRGKLKTSKGYIWKFKE